jgi:hypothetical protein
MEERHVGNAGLRELMYCPLNFSLEQAMNAQREVDV